MPKGLRSGVHCYPKFDVWGKEPRSGFGFMSWFLTMSYATLGQLLELPERQHPHVQADSLGSVLQHRVSSQGITSLRPSTKPRPQLLFSTSKGRSSLLSSMTALRKSLLSPVLTFNPEFVPPPCPQILKVTGDVLKARGPHSCPHLLPILSLSWALSKLLLHTHLFKE